MNLISRCAHSDSGMTSAQKAVDQTVKAFVRQAMDPKAIACLMAGGVAYRMGRIGAAGLGGRPAGRALSIGAGLTAEVSTFEMSHRSLSSVGAAPRGRPQLTGTHMGVPLQEIHPNLWCWSGSYGLKAGLLSSLITFGTLKSAGRIVQGQNLILQHLVQDTGMVLGHQASAALQIMPKPQGSLTEQFLHAEATNLQIGAGMALGHRLAPKIHSLERGVDLMLQSLPLSLGRRSGEEGLTRHFGLALAGTGALKTPALGGNPGLEATLLQVRIVDKLKEWVFGEEDPARSPLDDRSRRLEGPYRDPANGSLVSILERLRERFPHPEAVEAYTRMALQKKSENPFYLDEVEKGLAQIRDLMHHSDRKIHDAGARAYPQLVKKMKLSKEALYKEAALLRWGFLDISERRRSFIEAYVVLAKRFDKKDEAFWKEAGEVHLLANQTLLAQTRKLYSERDKELIYQLRGVEWSILKKMDWKDRGQYRYLTSNSFSEFVYDLFR